MGRDWLGERQPSAAATFEAYFQRPLPNVALHIADLNTPAACILKEVLRYGGILNGHLQNEIPGNPLSSKRTGRGRFRNERSRGILHTHFLQVIQTSLVTDLRELGELS